MLIWETKVVEVSELKGFEKNPRTITKAKKDILKRSLNTYGQAVPLICDVDLTVLGGNQRLELLKGKVTVRVPNRRLTDKERQHLNIALNNHIGDWDGEMLLQGLFSKEELKADFGIDPRVFNQVDFGAKEIDIEGEEFEIDEKSYIQLVLPTDMPVAEVLFELEGASGTESGEAGLVWLIEQYEKANV